MAHTSHIELNKTALKANIAFVKSELKNGSRYSMVIKGNAYGHGIEDIITLAVKCGVDHFSVFSIEEAKRAKTVCFGSCELMIMGFIDDESIGWAIKNEVSFYIFSENRLKSTIKKAKELQQKARIHLEVETGMNRTGFEQKELDAVIELVKKESEHLSIEGICTHLAGAESITNYDRIQDQLKSYHHLLAYFSKAGVYPKYRHIACSAAVLNYPETQLDLVRVGIANYGYWPSNELRMNRLLKQEAYEDPLKAVLSWKSEVMSLKNVAEGEFINYGKSYLTNRPTQLASVPVGYGYGFSRDLSNLGRVLINGHRLPVVGVVNMNMMLVDVTDLKAIKEGDEVILIGKQGDLEITVSSFSDMNNSLNYELLTRLPDHIPRITT